MGSYGLSEPSPLKGLSVSGAGSPGISHLGSGVKGISGPEFNNKTEPRVIEGSLHEACSQCRRPDCNMVNHYQREREVNGVSPEKLQMTYDPQKMELKQGSGESNGRGCGCGEIVHPDSSKSRRDEEDYALPTSALMVEVGDTAIKPKVDGGPGEGAVIKNTKQTASTIENMMLLIGRCNENVPLDATGGAVIPVNNRYDSVRAGDGNCYSPLFLCGVDMDAINPSQELPGVEIVDCTPLRMVCPNDLNFRSETRNKLVGRESAVTSEDSTLVEADVSWEFEVLSKTLGMEITGFEMEIVELLRRMKNRGVGKVPINTEGESQAIASKFDREMKRLECSINYGMKKGGKGPGRRGAAIALEYK